MALRSREAQGFLRELCRSDEAQTARRKILGFARGCEKKTTENRPDTAHRQALLLRPPHPFQGLPDAVIVGRLVHRQFRRSLLSSRITGVSCR